MLSKRIEVLKFRDYAEPDSRMTHSIPNLVDVHRFSIAKKPRSFADVHDFLRIEAHQSSAGSVCCYWIISKHNLAERSRSTVERAIALHRDDAVSDHEMNGNSCAHIENAFLYAFPVQNILRPSVTRWVRFQTCSSSRVSLQTSDVS